MKNFYIDTEPANKCGSSVGVKRRSNLLLDTENSFEIASLTTFARNDDWKCCGGRGARPEK